MSITRDAALRYVNEQEPEFLTEAKLKVNDHITYICPVCEQGTKHGKGLVKMPQPSPKGNYLYQCFGKCGRAYDTVDLWMYKNHGHFAKDASIEEWNAMYKRYNLDVGGSPSNYSLLGKTTKPVTNTIPTAVPKPTQSAKNSLQTQQPAKTPEKDFTEFYEDCHQRLLQVVKSQPELLRGIDLETIKRFKIGYSCVDLSRYSSGKFTVGALVIPTSKSSYTQRVLITRKDKDGNEGNRYYNRGSVHLFNLKALNGNQPTFIVEGAIDAMSIETLGFPAVGLEGVNNTDKLLQYLQTHKPSAPIIIALDDDDAGHEAFEKLSKDAAEVLGSNNVIWSNGFFNGYKDPNECLVNDKNTFIKFLQNATKQALLYQVTSKTQSANAEEANQKEANKKEVLPQSASIPTESPPVASEAVVNTEIEEAYKKKYSDSSLDRKIPSMMEKIRSMAKKPPLSTGFPNLDIALTGLQGYGLYTGLYILGALSSLGKTAFIMQIADHIAEGRTGAIDMEANENYRRDVLVFSLEMPDIDLMCRSVSRLTALESINRGYGADFASMTLEVRDGRRWNLFPEEKMTILQEAFEKYQGISNRIHIINNASQIPGASYNPSTPITTAIIDYAIGKHIEYTGNQPVVIVDYLQQLASTDPYATDKRKVDTDMRELRRIATDYDIPVLAISSLNRANYSEEISMVAFKESGAIEYSSDVLLGMQIHLQETDGKNNKREAIGKAIKRIPREIEVAVLKNRLGTIGKKVLFQYHPAYNLYKDKGLLHEEEEE